MPSQLGTEYWRNRAAEVRAEAAKVANLKARQMLLGIAENYDQLAVQSASDEASKKPPM